jgi:glycerate 2-kinase
VQVLVAPAGFSGALRATAVAAAIGRGLEAAGLEPPDLCPVADGGPGTLEVLLTRLGGESLATRVGGRDGAYFDVGLGLIGDSSTAIVELAGIPPAAVSGTSRAVGELILAGARTAADTVLVAAGGLAVDDAGAGLLAAIAEGGGLDGVRLVVLCPSRAHFVARAAGHGGEPGGIGEILAQAFGASIEPGAPLVLDAVGFDARMRAARALVVGEGTLDVGTLTGRVLGEAATRARQSGVPCHAIVGVNHLNRFDARILDLQEILEAPTLAELTAAAIDLAPRI